MTYLLDTNVWARYLNGRSPEISKKFREFERIQGLILEDWEALEI